MPERSIFNTYDKRTSTSRRTFNRAYHHKSPKQDAQHLYRGSLIRAFGEKINLSRKNDDFSLFKRESMESGNSNKQKMILMAKKIGCCVDRIPILVFGVKEETHRDFKKELKHLQNTMDDEEMKGRKPPPSHSHEPTRTLHQQVGKILMTGQSEDNKTTSRQLTFVILSSRNNEQLVRTILSSRVQWKEIKKGEGVPNFRWLAGDYDHNVFERSKTTTSVKRALNQFEFHHEVTAKNGLIRNLQIYTETKKIELFSMTPITFIIDFDEEYCEFHLRQLLNFFIKNNTKLPSQSPAKTNPFQKVNTFVERLRPYFNPHPQLRRKLNPLSRPLMQEEYLNGDGYLWLFKPTGLNRGRGIEIFDNLEDLEKILLNYLHLAGRKPSTTETFRQSARKELSGSVLPSITPLDAKKGEEEFVLKNCSFVVQKYIQKPLLLEGRKFDIRVWVLLNYDFSVYFFKEGYLRTSSEPFSLDVSNYFIHLTNNAIQKHSKEYGIFESGNQISFDKFRAHLSQAGKASEFQNILHKVKEYCYTTLSSVKNKLNPKQQKYCFQLFGFDYILDENLKVWLIEVNNNPCIELSSPLLQQLIPRMLNDAFKLSLDKIFGSSVCNPEEGAPSAAYSVDGYSDSENMWQQLGRLSPNSEYIPK